MKSANYTVYKALIAAYQRIGRSTEELAVRIDTTHAVGRISEEEYTELILALLPEAEHE